MSSAVHRFTYLGFFQLNDNLDREYFNGAVPHRTIEEQLVDSAETAQLNGELMRNECVDENLSSMGPIELCLHSDALQFVHSNSTIPFERIPLHKIKHIVSFENGHGSINVLLVESFAYSSDPRLGFVSRCHLLETECGDDNRGMKTADEFCKGFKQKFDEILAKLDKQ